MIENKALSGPLEERYAGWRTAEGKAMLSGKRSLEQIAERVVIKKIDPQPKSGRQEYLENIVNRYV
jgi:xylose isomerase